MMKKVLITPLDWGLGHATRCIPIIESFIKNDWDVHIACEDKPRSLLKNEFPELSFHSLIGVQITYPKRIPMAISMMLQMPQIILGIWRENQAVKDLNSKHSFDLIISDNRFGVYVPNVRNYYMTHQVTIAMPSPWTFLEPIGKWVHSMFYRKHEQLLIPDFPLDHPFRIAGHLSKSRLKKATYVGCLSRFKNHGENFDKKYDLLISLSGPEPSRTELETKICTLLKNSKFKVCLLRGLPLSEEQEIVVEGCEIKSYSHLNSKEFQEKLLQSKLVISRSGYSSIMDYFKLGVPALLIPTPGQTEQETLARDLSQQGLFQTAEQKTLRLQDIQNALHDKTMKEPQSNSDLLNHLWDKIHGS